MRREPKEGWVIISPNILFILIDDLGWRDLGCYGSSFYETPNIDRLADDGVLFTNAYAACPVCSPTRASILTGKYPARLGLTNYIAEFGEHPARGCMIDSPYIDHLPLEEKNIARALKDGGYTTWHVGKWHLGSEPFWPDWQGFDVNIGGCDWGHPRQGYFSPWGIPTLKDSENEEYLTDRLTTEAINLIENQDENPFFLNLAYYSVHVPIEAREALVEKYRRKAETMGLDKVPSFEEGEFFPCDHKKDQKILRRLVQSDPTYAAMVEALDDNIGRLLSSLERCGKKENTLVIFTSDNGGLSTAEGSPTTNSPLSEGKGWMYEGGTREPLIVHWPGVTEAGTGCNVPVTSPDFFPTILAAAGLDLIPDQHIDGVSLVPLLKGAKQLDREAVFWHYPHYGNQGGTPGCSMRSGDWKLIEFFEDGRLELYNLEDDIGETRDVSKQFSDRTRDMHSKLVKWRESVEALIPERIYRSQGRDK